MTKNIYDISLGPNAPVIPEWQDEIPCWEILYRDAGISVSVNPLTIKARYITGVILAHCRSVTILLGKEHLISTTYMPAFGVFASAVELLGRCLNGDGATKGKNSRNLKRGLQWVASPQADHTVNDNTVIATTRNGPHTIQELFDLRNFAAHGQAIHKSVNRYGDDPNCPIPINRHANCPIQNLDYLILGEIPPKLGAALEAYLMELRSNYTLAKMLARAGVLAFLDRPVFDSAWGISAAGDDYPRAVGDAIREMDWSYKWTLEDLYPVFSD